MSPVHGTPEGFDAGCTDVLTCPATHVHGLSCATAYIRFATGERRYMQLIGRNARPSQIAKALGITPQSAIAKELDDIPARQQGTALAKEPTMTRTGHTPIHALSSDLSRQDRAACRQWAFERGLVSAPVSKGRIPNPVVEAWLARHQDALPVVVDVPAAEVDNTMNYCDRGPCWMEYGHDGECMQDGHDDKRAPWPRPITTPKLQESVQAAVWRDLREAHIRVLEKEIERLSSALIFTMKQWARASDEAQAVHAELERLRAHKPVVLSVTTPRRRWFR